MAPEALFRLEYPEKYSAGVRKDEGGKVWGEWVKCVRFRMALYAYSKRPQGTTRTDQRQAPSVHTQSLSNHKAGASHFWADATVHRTYTTPAPAKSPPALEVSNAIENATDPPSGYTGCNDS